MKKILAVTFVVALLAPALAAAQGAAGGRKLGVGFERSLTLDAWTTASGPYLSAPLDAATVTYDGDRFRATALLGYASYNNDNTPDDVAWALAARGVFVVAKGDRSDLGVGGGVGIVRVDTGGEHYTHVLFELGAEIRLFVTANVAVTGRAGVSFVNYDDTDLDPIDHTNSRFLIGGDGVTSLGMSYFF